MSKPTNMVYAVFVLKKGVSNSESGAGFVEVSRHGSEDQARNAVKALNRKNKNSRAKYSLVKDIRYGMK